MHPLSDELSNAPIGKLIRENPAPFYAGGIRASLYCQSRRGMGDWDQLWRHRTYYGVYRIGDVEETFQFSRSDIDRAVESLAVIFSISLPLELRSNPFECAPMVIGFIPDQQRVAMSQVEYYVRKKHNLPIPSPIFDACSATDRKVIQSCLRYGIGKRWKKKQALWSRFVLAFAVPLSRLATDDNCMVVEDKPFANFESGSVIQVRSEEDRERILTLARNYGVRAYTAEQRVA